MKLHLHPSKKTVDKTTYTYYSVASTYRNEENVPRKIIHKKLGKLKPDEVTQWQHSIKIINQAFGGNAEKIFDLESAELKQTSSYLETALLSRIFDSLEIGNAFKHSSNSEIKTEQVTKILTISRLLDPQANYKTCHWLTTTFLPKIMNIDPAKYNKDKIFHELKNISEKRKALTKLFTRLSSEFRGEDLELYFFDATTSFFEGTCCSLAAPASEKTTGFQEKVIMICVVTDKKGYPITWEVFPGNKREVKEFAAIAKKLSEDCNIKDVTFCFDRGFVSTNNLSLIETGLESKFITGLDSDQVENVFDLENFAKNTRPKLLDIHAEIMKRERHGNNHKITPYYGFYKLGESRYYSDLGVTENRRHVVSFNVDIFERESKIRSVNIEEVKQQIEELNNNLSNAKKDRDNEPISTKINNLLKKYRLTKIVTYEIIPVSVQGSRGSMVQSHKVKYKINNDEIERAKRQDGILVYLTDHIESTKGVYGVSAMDIVSHYKDKYVIENLFRHLKSYIDLRPFYVYLPEHVNAHIDICMTAYFINTYIYHKLSKVGISLDQFYTALKSNSAVCELETRPGGPSVSLLKSPSKEMMEILSLFNAQDLVSKPTLTKLGIAK